METIIIEKAEFSKLNNNLEKLIQVLTESNLEERQKESSTKNSKNSLGDEWLDNEDVCKLLRITKRTLQNYRDKFILPYSQIGKKNLYKKKDVEKLLEEHYYAVE